MTSSSSASAPHMKFIFVTGGVVSGLGKGITASSIGLLLKRAGIRVTSIKIDPYLNIDAGTMSPYEHGEVFVMDDGGEVDLDLGNYERFLDVHLTRDHNITTGKVYQKVLTAERAGAYLGKTVQMVPHISNCIIDWILEVAQRPVTDDGGKPQVCIIELGGTVGDIESLIFCEAIRQLRYRSDGHVCQIHVSLIPSLGNVGELKSKPTQHSMIHLRTVGLLPDVIVLRCVVPVPEKIMKKISVFAMVPISRIVSVHDVSNIYLVPDLLLKQNMINMLFDILNVRKVDYPLMRPIDITRINRFGNQLSHFKESNVKSVRIGIVGKYTALEDCYLSVTKALLSASLNCELKLEIVWIESRNLERFGLNHSNNHPNALLAMSETVDENTEVPAVALPTTKAEAVAVAVADAGAAEEDGHSAFDAKVASVERMHAKQSTANANANDDGEISEDRKSDELSDDVVEEHRDSVHGITIESAPAEFRKRRSVLASKDAWKKLRKVDGILIPGGFGDRGIEGKILAVQYAREHKKPFLGICLGLQMAVIEFCRNVLGLKNANSTEFNKSTPHPAVIFMPEGSTTEMGATMRLGARNCHLNEKSLAHYLYGNTNIVERHRHRYEVNPQLVSQIESRGLVFSGKDDKRERMEIIEFPVSEHPFFFGTQFHPEFLSGPLRPSPPFTGLIKASAGTLHSEPEFKEFFFGNTESNYNSSSNNANPNDTDATNSTKSVSNANTPELQSSPDSVVTVD